jgi:hypothetical protein
MRVVSQFVMLGYRFHCASNKATCPSTDDSVTDNVHISDSGWETNRPGLFWHIIQRSHPFSHFSHQKSSAVSGQRELRQSCGDAQPYLPPRVKGIWPSVEWTNPWPLVKSVRAKNLHLNCTDFHMSVLRRYNLRIWAQIPRFYSGRVDGAESCLIDWQSRTRTRNTRPFVGYGDSLLCSQNLSVTYLTIRMDLVHTYRPFSGRFNGTGIRCRVP